MGYLGIEYAMDYVPELDRAFVPMGAWMNAYEALAKRPVSVAVEATGGRVVVRHTALIMDGAHDAADYRYLERLVKFLLWSAGGFRVYICGAGALAERLKRAYAPGGERAFDAQFMDDVFERGFEIVACTEADFPQSSDASVAVGGHMNGCRIGSDAMRLAMSTSSPVSRRTLRLPRQRNTKPAPTSRAAAIAKISSNSRSATCVRWRSGAWVAR